MKKTIEWKCTATPTWEWMSGSSGNPGFPVKDDDTRSGTISLSPNADYWYPCVDLVLQGVCKGNAYLRYYQENGQDLVQAITVAQGQWTKEGDPGRISYAKAEGGIDLHAEILAV